MTNNSPNEAKNLGDWAYIALDKHFSKMEKHEALVLDDQDPEELHQMRVGMRRLRSVIVGFSQGFALPKNATEKAVGKVARILGELRDLDVLKDTLETHYLPMLPHAEQKPLKQALKSLGQERKQVFKEVKKTLLGKKYLKLKASFQDWLENPTYGEMAYLPIEMILPDLLLPQISHLLLHSGWLVGVNFKDENFKIAEKLTRQDLEKVLTEQGQALALHELRKEAKRSRYNMELFTQFYGKHYQDYIQDIKTIQSVLGEIQDSFVLKEFLAKVLGESKLKKMPTLVQTLQENRFKKWQEWQPLQQKFLDAKTRIDLHQVILSPPEASNNHKSSEMEESLENVEMNVQN